MEIINNNEKIRELIFQIFEGKRYLTIDGYYDDIDKLYDILSMDKELFDSFVNIMYISSYAVNYGTLINNPDDENIINDVNILDNIDFKYIDKETFRYLVSDTVLYNQLDYYSKRKYYIYSLRKKDYLLKKVPLFVNDMLYFCKNYTIDYIINYYYIELNSNIEKEDAIKKQFIILDNYYIICLMKIIIIM